MLDVPQKSGQKVSHPAFGFLLQGAELRGAGAGGVCAMCVRAFQHLFFSVPPESLAGLDPLDLSPGSSHNRALKSSHSGEAVGQANLSRTLYSSVFWAIRGFRLLESNPLTPTRNTKKPK